MRGVGRQVTQMERLIHYPLPGKSCISMQENGHHLWGQEDQTEGWWLAGFWAHLINAEEK